jgi:DNA-binding LacI/PurR family transcriptional regulator
MGGFADSQAYDRAVSELEASLSKLAPELDVAELAGQIDQLSFDLGFDDAETRFSVFPTMTAVCQDATHLGAQAAAELLCLVNGETHGVIRKQLPTYFEVNRSTGPPSRPT